MNNFHALLSRNEHIEPKSSVKSVAADSKFCDFCGFSSDPQK